MTLNSANDTVAIVADDDGVAANGRGNMDITNTQASLTVTDASGDTHGLTVRQNNTTLSGGTTSTELTLDDSGATFADEDTGDPVRVTGVADGTTDFDAVNFRHLRKLDAKIDNVATDAFSGIASAAALAGIPEPAPGKRISLGVGYANYKGENAVAFGGKAISLNM
ncbi:MAG: hypothetical protein SCARUB_00499 [Candidatus Scalindua rubra]|uniref:Trimeric autotransporter adhesin YadA-like stalk domain-containing protein n=1 Tax=Candidatus Scalindua rubra TaxID=1872076 RepID=A0A1E3XFJ5_9BACT|nr:MAG: hypothetical protein SCARUB_00499 [Candidatus Scalindua rubra]